MNVIPSLTALQLRNHNFEFPLVLVGSLRKSYIAYRKSVLFVCKCLILKQIPRISAWCKFTEPNHVCMRPFIQKSLSLFYLWTQSHSKKKNHKKVKNYLFYAKK